MTRALSEWATELEALVLSAPSSPLIEIEALLMAFSIEVAEVADHDLSVARAALDEARRERDAYKRAKAENDERFMRERDEARERCREAAQVLIEAVGADGPCDVGDAARRAVEALGAARAAAIEECAKVCDDEARTADGFIARTVDCVPAFVARETARGLAARLRALLEPGT